MNTNDGKLEADLITLEVGANDTAVSLGTIYDTGNDTFCGALNQCIRYLQKNTTAQIVVISSTNGRYKSGEPSTEFVPERKMGPDKHTKFDQWKATEEVCRINSVPYIPMGDQGGMGYARMINDDKYIVDNIHHTILGGYNLGKFVWGYLRNIPVWATLAILTQPESWNGYIGDTAVLKVVAGGSGLTYQWEISKNGGISWGNTTLDGYNTNTLTINPVADSHNGRMYRCTITNSDGNIITSRAAKITAKNHL